MSYRDNESVEGDSGAEGRRRRKEHGWSGEWNAEMGEVVRELRGLKM